jgi:hypothetical protein
MSRMSLCMEILTPRAGCAHASKLLKFINPYATWLGCKCTTYVGMVRGQSTGKEVTTEFTLLESLDVQISKKGVVQRLLVIYVKHRK